MLGQRGTRVQAPSRGVGTSRVVGMGAGPGGGGGVWTDLLLRTNLTRMRPWARAQETATHLRVMELQRGVAGEGHGQPPLEVVGEGVRQVPVLGVGGDGGHRHGDLPQVVQVLEGRVFAEVRPVDDALSAKEGGAEVPEGAVPAVDAEHEGVLPLLGPEVVEGRGVRPHVVQPRAEVGVLGAIPVRRIPREEGLRQRVCVCACGAGAEEQQPQGVRIRTQTATVFRVDDS